jgi:hypothetical protein
MRGEWQQVLCLLNEMQIAKIALNTRTVNEVMAAFAKAEGPKGRRTKGSVGCFVKFYSWVFGVQRSGRSAVPMRWRNGSGQVLEILQVPNLISALASHNVLI